MNSEEKFWVAMAITEVRTQCEFAKRSYLNINEKTANNPWLVFSSLHSFLSHCAMISKMLKAKGATISIEDAICISSKSAIHNRRFRNHLEHYDARLVRWIKKAGVGSTILNHAIGDKKKIRRALNKDQVIFVKSFDPEKKVFTFVDEEFDLEALMKEVNHIGQKANSWMVKTKVDEQQEKKKAELNDRLKRLN